MRRIDYSKFNKIQELIEIAELEHVKDRILWLPDFEKEDAALAIAKMYVTAKAGVSDSIPVRKKAREATDRLFFEVSEKIHIFAKIEARDRFGYTNEDVVRLFKHIAFGGEKYR